MSSQAFLDIAFPTEALLLRARGIGDDDKPVSCKAFCYQLIQQGFLELAAITGTSNHYQVKLSGNRIIGRRAWKIIRDRKIGQTLAKQLYGIANVKG